MDQAKALGPNGFGAVFYHAFWYTLGLEVCQVVKEFFNKGKILKELNHMFIDLVPKNDDPCVTYYTFLPISVCSTVHKIIVKILVSRLYPCLNGIISSYESSFVLNRSIYDNILLVHEIMKKG